MLDSLSLAADIAAAYASNPKHSVGAKQLPQMLRKVAKTLDDLEEGRPTLVAWTSPVDGEIVGPRRTKLTAAAVSAREGADFLTCLECGRQLKMLKRHLKTAHKGLTPDQYRAKHGLAEDAPIVAGNYITLRSGIAIANRLGHKKVFPKSRR